SRSRAWHSSGRVYHALGARLDTRTVAGWSVRSTLGLASRILFSRAAGPHRRYPDGILGATAGGCASRTAFRQPGGCSSDSSQRRVAARPKSGESFGMVRVAHPPLSCWSLGLPRLLHLV